MKNKKILILGAGSFAREVYHWASQTGQYDIGGFFDNINLSKNDFVFGRKIYRCFDDVNIDAFDGFVVGVGDTAAKEKLFSMAVDNNLIPVTVIHPTVQICHDSIVEEGCVLCPNVVVTTNVIIRRGTILNLGVTVGHDCIINEYSTVSPQAAISGNCKIGRNVYVGTKSCLREEINICDEAVIGMGSVVVRHITQKGTYAGCPARRIS